MSDRSVETLRFGAVKTMAYSLVLISLLFGLVEGGLRIYVYLFRTPIERFDLAAGTFVLKPGVYPRGRETAIINSRGFVGLEFEDPPPPGTRRIVAIGDSCTFGMATRNGHYPALLESRLNRNDEGRRYQVINAAVEGLNSELALRRLRSKALTLRADIVTIYIGWNDLMKFDPAGQLQSPRLAIVARVFDKLWTVRVLRKLLFYYLRPRLFPPRTVPRDEPATWRTTGRQSSKTICER